MYTGTIMVTPMCVDAGNLFLDVPRTVPRLPASVSPDLRMQNDNLLCGIVAALASQHFYEEAREAIG